MHWRSSSSEENNDFRNTGEASSVGVGALETVVGSAIDDDFEV
jgi:hypothetical protein